MQVYTRVEVKRHSFLTLALDGGKRSASRPGRFTPGQKPPYPLNRRLNGPQNVSGGPQSMSGRVTETQLSLDLLGFEPRNRICSLVFFPKIK
jgi:hypothetical protein